MNPEVNCSELYNKIKELEQTNALLRSREQRLRESEQYFKEVLQHSRDVILRRSLKTGAFAYISEATEQLSGITSQEMKNMSVEEFFALVHPDDRKRIRDHLASAFLSPEKSIPLGVEYRLQKPDGILCMAQ